MEQLLNLLTEMQIPSDKVKSLRRAFKSNNTLAIRVSLSWFTQELNKYQRVDDVDKALLLIESIMKGKR